MNNQSIKRILLSYIGINDEVFNNFQENIEHAYSKKYNDLSQQENLDPKDAGEILSIEKDTKNLGYNLLVIALYDNVEINIKTIAKSFYGGGNDIVKELFKYKKIVKYFGLKGIKIEKINGHSEFNELRLICNSIKHVGRVSGELACNYPEWKKDEKFEGLNLHFKRIFPKTRDFLTGLIEECSDRSRP